MTSNVPVVRQISWTSIIPQILLIGLLIYIFQLFDFGDPFLAGALTYAILSFGLRKLVARAHRKGIKLVKHQKFVDAIPFFEKSVDYFSKNSWVDRFRFITLLSSSKLTYKEMGLCNIAFCYSQTGNGLKAKEVYEQILMEYPDNGLANAGLNMLNSLKTIF